MTHRIIAALLLAVCPLNSSATTTPELSTTWIVDQIRAHDLRTLDGLLEKFSKKSLERHLLAYGSRSRQFASFLSPRVIVYNYDADFIMAFNGEPNAEGYHELEILKFDQERRAFDPQVIHFDPKGKKAPRLDPHPTDCAGCHQSDPRPNWDPYFHWPGFYGSEDDNMIAATPVVVRLTSGPELGHYAKFLEKKKAQIEEKKGRYRFLPEHPSERPNLDFNDRVTCLNMKRFLRIFSAHPLSGSIWPHVVSGRVEVDRLPPHLLARARRTYPQVRSDTEVAILDMVRQRIDRHLRLTGAMPQGRARELLNRPIDPYHLVYDLDEAASWRFVFEEILGQPFLPLSTSRTLDYQLNIGAGSNMMTMGSGYTLDRESGRVLFSLAPQDVSPPGTGYGYNCVRR